MGCGGAEKSLLSLLSLIDYQKYDITLLMFQRGGMFEPLLPSAVRIHDALDYMSFCAQPAGKQLLSFDLRRLTARLRTSLFLRQNARKGCPLHDAQAYWKHASTAFDPLPECYDIAIAWGQGTPTHFVAEKVTAQRKLRGSTQIIQMWGIIKSLIALFTQPMGKSSVSLTNCA